MSDPKNRYNKRIIQYNNSLCCNGLFDRRISYPVDKHNVCMYKYMHNYKFWDMMI